MSEILPAKPIEDEEVREERRQAQAVGRVVIFLTKKGKENWKFLLLALAFVFNSPYTKSAVEGITGWHLSGPPAAAVVDVEIPGEPWKAKVDRRLKKLEISLKNVEDQENLIVQLIKAQNQE